MKKSLLALMCFVSMSTVAVQSVAAEKQETPVNNKTQVLGQQSPDQQTAQRPPATQADQKAAQGQAQAQPAEQANSQPTPEQVKAKQAREAQALFEESLRQMMPLGNKPRVKPQMPLTRDCNAICYAHTQHLPEYEDTAGFVRYCAGWCV